MRLFSLDTVTFQYTHRATEKGLVVIRFALDIVNVEAWSMGIFKSLLCFAIFPMQKHYTSSCIATSPLYVGRDPSPVATYKVARPLATKTCSIQKHFNLARRNQDFDIIGDVLTGGHIERDKVKCPTPVKYVAIETFAARPYWHIKNLGR